AFDRSTPPNAYTTDYFADPTQGLFDPASIVLLLIGLGALLASPAASSSQVMFIWTSTAMGVALLTSVIPRRLLLLSAPLSILLGVGALRLYDGLRRELRTRGFVHRLVQCSALFALSAFAVCRIHDYFVGTPQFNEELHPAFSSYRRELIQAAD